jgi:N-acetylglutamate synthase-like GNAT family acetyltransferase
MVEPMTIAEIDGTDPAFVAALADAGLPTDDLAEDGRRFFAFRGDGSDILGYGGVEGHSGIALLRSLVVVRHRRGRGIGLRMVNWILDELRACGGKEAYLLTTTATAFGTRCGFQRLDRDSAPDPIRNSRQMTALCPATAVLMGRLL